MFINMGRFWRFMPFIDPYFIPRDRTPSDLDRRLAEEFPERCKYLLDEVSPDEHKAILGILGHDMSNSILAAYGALRFGLQKRCIGENLTRMYNGKRQLTHGNELVRADILEMMEFLVESRNKSKTREIVSFEAEPGNYDALTYPGIVFLNILHYVQNAEDQHRDLGVEMPVEVSVGTLKLRDLGCDLGPNQHLYGPETDLIRISVKDYGNGIQDEVLPHIFKPGFSGRGSSGIGLGLSDLIFHRLHGVGRVDEAIGIGSTFSSYFPRIRTV